MQKDDIYKLPKITGIVGKDQTKKPFSTHKKNYGPYGEDEDSLSIDTTQQNLFPTVDIYTALQTGNKELVKILILRGADLNQKDANGMTILHHAMQSQDLDFVKFLIKNGAKVDAQDAYGLTPLHHAIKNGNKELVKILLDNGAKVDTQDSYGLTPLHHAIKNGNEELVKILLDNGANVNVSDNYGRTPTHYTMNTENIEIVQLIAKKEPNLNKKDEFALTPIDYAFKKGYIKQAEILTKNSKVEITPPSHQETRIKHDTTEPIIIQEERSTIERKEPEIKNIPPQKPEQPSFDMNKKSESPIIHIDYGLNAKAMRYAVETKEPLESKSIVTKSLKIDQKVTPIDAEKKLPANPERHEINTKKTESHITPNFQRAIRNSTTKGYIKQEEILTKNSKVEIKSPSHQETRIKRSTKKPIIIQEETRERPPKMPIIIQEERSPIERKEPEIKNIAPKKPEKPSFDMNKKSESPIIHIDYGLNVKATRYAVETREPLESKSIVTKTLKIDQKVPPIDAEKKLPANPERHEINTKKTEAHITPNFQSFIRNSTKGATDGNDMSPIKSPTIAKEQSQAKTTIQSKKDSAWARSLGPRPMSQRK
ncbi:MAG: ankyrin repeat domain-containing protein [Rickettsiaceae bacterium]|nr:ankyrin repeat domain-containing protein [Rickettsiaceae bacterium]